MFGADDKLFQKYVFSKIVSKFFPTKLFEFISDIIVDKLLYPG